MYKHRSRMAVLYEKKHDIIKIKCTDRESRYKNIYREMREELKRVIGRRDIDLQRECEKNMLIKVIEPIVYLIIIVNLVIAISYKRKSKKTPVKVVVPIVILGIGLFVCDTIYTHRSFSSVEKAVEAYGDNAEIIRILQGENSTYVIMDNEGTVEGKIFPESSGKWKLPDSIFYGTGREYQDVKINVDMSTIEINGEWYVLVAPNDDNYVIADVKDSVGTEFLEAENNKNEKICYGYMEHKPKDYWISVNGEKISLD